MHGLLYSTDIDTSTSAASVPHAASLPPPTQAGTRGRALPNGGCQGLQHDSLSSAMFSLHHHLILYGINIMLQHFFLNTRKSMEICISIQPMTRPSGVQVRRRLNLVSVVTLCHQDSLVVMIECVNGTDDGSRQHC